MKNGLQVIVFSRSYFRFNGGMEKRLFIDLLKALPSDAMIVGFQESLATDTAGILVESDTFGATPAGMPIPEIHAQFQRYANGEAVLVKLEYPHERDSVRAKCNHVWTSWAGLNMLVEYCKVCGENKT